MNDIKLGVNIDHVATLRQSRQTRYPDPVDAALAVERAGANSLTIHLREDRRHIQDRDLRILSEVINIPMNLEMAVTDEMIAIACDTRPQYCCLVPERREELTTEGGLDVAGQLERITGAVSTLQNSGIRVSLFIDADDRQIDSAADTGSDMIEIHTGHYADKTDAREKEQELEKIVGSVTHASRHRMQINAGHGLNYHNVLPVAAIAEIKELNIGHAIIARAVFTGLENAVREMLRLIQSAR